MKNEKKKGNYLPKYIKADDMREILKTPENERNRLILQILYRCGLRVGELVHLKIGDINLDERELFVRKGKGNKQRVVILDDVISGLLSLYLRDSTPEDYDRYLFQSSHGGHLTTRSIQYIVEKCGKKAGLTQKITPHMFRHSLAVHSIKAGMNIRSVQKRLGHSSLKTTMIYLDLTMEDVRDDIRKYPLPI